MQMIEQALSAEELEKFAVKDAKQAGNRHERRAADAQARKNMERLAELLSSAPEVPRG